MFRPITRDRRLSFALLRPCILNSLFYAIRNEVEKISRTLLNGVVTSAMLHQQTAASTALTSAPYSTSNREPFSSLSSSFVLLDIYSAFTSDARMQKLRGRNWYFLGRRIFSSFSQINLLRQREETIIDSLLRIFNCQVSIIGKLKEIQLKKVAISSIFEQEIMCALFPIDILRQQLVEEFRTLRKVCRKSF